jgi:hypothetical protein
MHCTSKETRDWGGAEGNLEISHLIRFVLVHKSVKVARVIHTDVEFKVGCAVGGSHVVIGFNGLLRLLIYNRYEKLKNREKESFQDTQNHRHASDPSIHF